MQTIYLKSGLSINKQKFIKWLKEAGCELLPPTNDYEAIRFRGMEVGVIYTSGSVSNPYTSNAVYCFSKNKKWNGKPISTGRSNSYKYKKKQILKRDGNKCFYCGLPLNDDVTLEHIDPLTAGGKNKLSNMVLAHDKCNREAGSKTIVEKVTIAINNRIKLKTGLIKK